MNKKLSAVLLLCGLAIILLALSGVKFKSREEVFRVRDFRATATTRKTVPAFRYAGFAALAGAVIYFVAGWRKQRLS